MKSAAGFQWKYYEDDYPLKIEKYIYMDHSTLCRNQYKTIYQYDLNNNLVRKWESKRLAEREGGYVRSSLTNAIKFGKIYKGYIWSESEFL